MIGDIKKVILVGRLGTDPSSKQTQGGVALASFPLATSKYFKKHDADGNTQPTEETQWHRVVAWGKQAESCTQFLRKGQKVYVEGSIRGRKYTNKAGEERFFQEVHAEKVSFMGFSRSEAEKVDPMVENLE